MRFGGRNFGRHGRNSGAGAESPLPIGSTINGVFIADNSTAVPLFPYIPGYSLFNVRGGYRFNENHEINFAFENIADKSHRLPGWGIDGPGRSFNFHIVTSFSAETHQA